VEIARLDNDPNYPDHGVLKIWMEEANDNSKDPSLSQLNNCGCFEGLKVTVPAEIDNRPGLKALAYRIGTYGIS